MNNNNPNPSIRCTVNECAHHCGDVQYCALTSVQIGTHESHPTEQKCVDCESFKCKSK